MMIKALLVLSIAAASFALKAPLVVPNSLTKVVMSPLPKVYVYDHCPFCGTSNTSVARCFNRMIAVA